MEKLEISKVLLEAADSLAEQVEKEKENGFLILIKENDSVRIRECCTLMDVSDFIGALMEGFAKHLEDIGMTQTSVEKALKGFAEIAVKNVFEEGEADEG